MRDPARIKPVPWDSAAFGFDCYEIIDPDPAVVGAALAQPGHYTAKIDPLADKIYIGLLVIAMTAYGLVPLWFLLVILGRDLLIVLGGLWAKRKLGVVLPSNYPGKAAALTTATTLFLVLSGLSGQAVALMEYLSVALMALSFAVYGQRLRSLLIATRTAWLACATNTISSAPSVTIAADGTTIAACDGPFTRVETFMPTLSRPGEGISTLTWISRVWGSTSGAISATRPRKD